MDSCASRFSIYPWQIQWICFLIAELVIFPWVTPYDMVKDLTLSRRITLIYGKGFEYAKHIATRVVLRKHFLNIFY